MTPCGAGFQGTARLTAIARAQGPQPHPEQAAWVGWRPEAEPQGRVCRTRAETPSGHTPDSLGGEKTGADGQHAVLVLQQTDADSRRDAPCADRAVLARA